MYAAFLGTFGFYAYTRLEHTVSMHVSAGLGIYQVLVLLAELLIFLSGAQYGLIHVRLFPKLVTASHSLARVTGACELGLHC